MASGMLEVVTLLLISKSNSLLTAVQMLVGLDCIQISLQIIGSAPLQLTVMVSLSRLQMAGFSAVKSTQAQACVITKLNYQAQTLDGWAFTRIRQQTAS